MSNGWETAKSIGAIGGAAVTALTVIAGIINRFYKFVTWTDLRRTIAAITETQKTAAAAETARVDVRHAVNTEAMAEIKSILEQQNRQTHAHRESVNRAIGSLVTDMAVVKQRVQHLEGDKR